MQVLCQDCEQAVKPLLAHKKQEGKIGCMYLSAWAVIQDDSLLQHVDDYDDLRWRKRLAELGWLLYPVFCVSPSTTAKLIVPWVRSTYRMERGDRLYLLTSYTEGIISEKAHQVALLFRKWSDEDITVWVSDSRKDSDFSINLPDFLDTPYARPYLVEGLAPMEAL